MTVDVALHTAPICELAQPPPHLFQCPPSLWTVELSVMSIGGMDETHATLPLRPSEDDGSTEEDGPATVALPTLALCGGRYELRVLRCLSHYARGARPAEVAAAGETSTRPAASRSRSAFVSSEYPMLLMHVQIALRCISRAEDTDADEGTVSKSPMAPAVREAQELGDAIERMLLLG